MYFYILHMFKLYQYHIIIFFVCFPVCVLRLIKTTLTVLNCCVILFSVFYFICFEWKVGWTLRIMYWIRLDENDTRKKITGQVVLVNLKGRTQKLPPKFLSFLNISYYYKIKCTWMKVLPVIFSSFNVYFSVSTLSCFLFIIWFCVKEVLEPKSKLQAF